MPKPAAVPMLDLKAQYASIRKEIRAAIEAVLESQQFILGPNVKALEEEMATYCGTKFAVGVASGTDALILALHAAGVGAGDEVICPTFTYIATGDAISLLGARPVFADVFPDTYNLNPHDVEGRITSRTKAIVPVHLYGQPADMDPVMEVARKRGIAVIEDNAQAIGARYKGRRTGSIGEMGCISFFPSKNLGAYGDGGMIVTNSEKLADRLRSLRGHGTRTHKYLSEEQGWNSRLDEIQAAVLRVKLRHLDKWAEARRANAARYDKLLGAIPGVRTPQVAPWAEHVYHQYTIRVSNRDRVQELLAQEGVPSTVYYPVPMHLQVMFKSRGVGPGTLPFAERAANEVLSLPIYAELQQEQIERVAAALAKAIRS
ncbi:MAG: DegT/DnrJ/EryC1/StrS family aminotransferase [Acidobacteria bacterium]|nr:DegT/DnrJ/EryC1/StrS family aminotransferase [Acidobacteriota bacterium]